MLSSRSSACSQRPSGKSDLSDCPPSKLRRCPAIGQVTAGRGLHSFPIQLNLSSSVHRITRPSS
jgi:hypothetical protein